MAGTVLAAGAVACMTALAVGLAGVGAAAVRAQMAAAAVDAAALAAADTAFGLVAGIPCDRAAQVGAADGATITSCAVHGLVATVVVAVPFGPLAATAAARAGPPPDDTPPRAAGDPHP